jgi:hypothetical protein
MGFEDDFVCPNVPEFEVDSFQGSREVDEDGERISAYDFSFLVCGEHLEDLFREEEAISCDGFYELRRIRDGKLFFRPIEAMRESPRERGIIRIFHK